ncbi:MAG: ARMT1-like domain-containing protein [Desulfurococcaceae archaeon]
MKPSPECLKCILNIRLTEIEHSDLNDVGKLELMKKLLELMIKMFDKDGDLTMIATLAYNFVVDNARGVVDYYKNIKRKTMSQAMRNIAEHWNYAMKLDDFNRFEYLIKLSALGNLIDYGVYSHVSIPLVISREMVESSEIAVNNAKELYDLLRNGGLRIAWLFDNSGEAVYDMLLIRLIRAWGNEVIGVVKDEPGFQNDVTRDDLSEFKLDKELDGMVTYGCRCSTIHLDNIGNEARKVIQASDLIIAKGMANFEYLYDIDLGKPIAFILIPKCDPVAAKIGSNSRNKPVVLLKK